ncbi:MAG: LLM class flavin-dependent oxidoreductase [Armatimonadetes bacterium]|nr:LLM class flavin-dependent oxidoreductase [Armatimonadota bacterium]
MASLTLSVLDLAPVGSGTTAAQAFQNTLDLARRVERLGYRRYWLAEHHNMPGIASSAPEILIGQVARETSTIRVGSGGIMLPNHTPLHIAEAFRTLEALFPGRIDLGIGRAAGTDARTALALGRIPGARGGEDLPGQLADLFAFGGAGFPEGHSFRSVAAVPSDVPLPPVWLLGSSDYGARLAGELGLGFAFAHHINPYGTLEAMQIYRDAFTPSRHLDAPRTILTVSVICAETALRAEELASSLDLAWLRLYSGQPGPLPSPAEARTYPYTPQERMHVENNRTRLILGEPAGVWDQLCALAGRAGTDEVMVTTMVHDHGARVRSYELLAQQQ